MTTHIFATQDEQLQALLNTLKLQISEMLTRQERVVIAVSGGKSPIPFFSQLSNLDLPWQQITFTLVDERITATDSIDSNEHLVHNYLLQNRAAKAQFIGLVNTTLSEFEMVREAHVRVPPIDIAILGMGEDGHTASIFSDSQELVLATDLTHSARYICIHAPSAKYARISLTLRSLVAIKSLYLVISGKIKFSVYNEALKGANMDYPVSLVLKHRPDLTTYWAE